MNRFSAFLKTRWGLGTVGAAFLVLVFFAWPRSQGDKGPSPIPASTNASTLTQIDHGAGSIPTPVPPPVVLTNAPKRPVILSLDANLPMDTNAMPTVFAPAGCSLKCVLVNSLESIRIDTPVIGLVIEDVWFGGQLIVPKDTKVLGKAQVDRVRDRLAAAGSWALVFPSGEELIVAGTALHCDESPDGRRHGPDDGTSGFKGTVIRNASWDELKLFASTFLSAMARSQQQSDYTIYGSQLRQSLQNSTAAGTASVLDEYARSIAETIKRDGVYVHVAGGSLFYLFLPQILDRSAARVGATRRSN